MIVFDGYCDGPNTKDATHRIRAGTAIGANVHFSGTHVFKGKKDDFLHNSDNQQRFISLLREHLEKCHCATYQALADADLLIVDRTIAAAHGTETPTILVGDDRSADSLVLSYPSQFTQHLLSPRTQAWDKTSSWMLEHHSA